MSKLFRKDSYWYFQKERNYLGMNQCVDVDEAKSMAKGVVAALREKYSNGRAKPNDMTLDFIRCDTVYKGGKEIKVREGKDYLYPIILFSKNGKLMVKGTAIDDDDDEVTKPNYSCTLDKDFVLGDYDMDEDIFSAIKKRFGVQPISLHYIGDRWLHGDTLTSNEEGIPRIYDEDDEYPEEEGHIDVDFQDVLLCTEWDGKISIPLEEGEELVFMDPNKFYHPSLDSFDNRIKSTTLLEALTLEVGSYYVWGNLLYHLVGLEKMQIK